MKIKIILLLFSFLFANCQNKLEFRFASGFKGGTYEQIGISISKLNSFQVKLQNTEGSIDNIFLIKDNKADISISQLDVLQNSVLGDQDIQKKVKVLFPLYGEEVHFIAKKQYSTVESLVGKKISIGDSESGTKMTSLIFLSQFGINNDNTTLEEWDAPKSLEKLLAGELDALVLVAGYPVQILSQLPETVKNQIQILPFTNQSLQAVRGTNITYQKSEIPSGTYSWESKPIETILVQSVFIGRGDLTEKQVIQFTKTIWKNKPTLLTLHDKWKQLDKSHFESIRKKNESLFHPAVLKIFSELE
jgi:TRAP transporter TAXI family solute receptor